MEFYRQFIQDGRALIQEKRLTTCLDFHDEDNWGETTRIGRRLYVLWNALMAEFEQVSAGVSATHPRWGDLFRGQSNLTLTWLKEIWGLYDIIYLELLLSVKVKYFTRNAWLAWCDGQTLTTHSRSLGQYKVDKGYQEIVSKVTLSRQIII